MTNNGTVNVSSCQQYTIAMQILGLHSQILVQIVYWNLPAKLDFLVKFETSKKHYTISIS